ncbi:CocE/NonD family hydrolase [Pseudonocardia sp. CA-107938]|uniref:CocE/NonD family hydrolase n=1 Tax=Pseudonocardia sp. CA-107938 TaxID=3240021 RepID=UPI003D8B6916
MPAPTAEPRSFGMRLLDRAVAAATGLPRSAGDYVVTRGVRVPMRDGVELVADHYAPYGATARGTVLIRSPYGRTGIGSIMMGRVFADQGYHVLLQSCRGTFGSGASFDPMQHEIDDGHDTVAWLRAQPWFDGRLATVGGSYLGFVQWALLMDPPPELRTAIVVVGPHDMHRSAWGTGAFSLDDFFGWSEMMVHQEDPGRLRGAYRQLTTARRLAPGMNGAPLLAAGERLLLGKAPWYREWLRRPQGDDPFWTRLKVGAALDNVQVPVLLIAGWMDLFLDQTLEQYTHLRGRDVDVALTVGPWTHTEVFTKGSRTVLPEQVAWLDRHLSEGRTGDRPARVRAFVTGEGGGWRGLADWPPPHTDDVLYLHPHGGLAAEPPGTDEPASEFTYDPADPTPSIGGRLLAPGVSGVRDNRVLAARADVLAFTSAPLTEPLEIGGTPVVELAHRSDNPHCDVFVRICDVAPDGRAINVSDAFRRLVPGEHEADLVLRLDACAHRFAAGHRIQVLVAGGAHTRYARNLGTAEPADAATTLVPSHRRIEHGRSRVLLPVVGR